MRSTIFITKILILSVFSVVGFLHSATVVRANSEGAPCKKVEVIFARGSGEDLKDREQKKFTDELNRRLGQALSVNHYELGSPTYSSSGGFRYPAVPVNFPEHFDNAVGAFISSGAAYIYGESIRQGYGEFHNYLNERYEKCKSSNPFYVLAGYSQGAQVIGQSLVDVPEYIRERIVFVALFGDPKLHFPEGEDGNWFNPPAPCRGGKSSWSVYRETLGDCWLSEGRLGARKPYLPDDMKSKIGVWCHANDFVCGTSHWPFDHGHGSYDDPGKGIEWAAWKASEKIKQAIASEPSPPPQKPNDPSPPPPIYQTQLIDTEYHFGMGINGQDVALVIDFATPMKPELPGIKKQLMEILPKIAEKYGRFHIHLYAPPTLGDPNFTYVSKFPVETNEYILNDLDNMLELLFDEPYVSSGHGSALFALKDMLDSINWTYGAAKSAILITNNREVTDPDVNGISVADIFHTALAIDPVNIYPVVPEGSSAVYEQIAKDTSGQIVTFTENSIDRAIESAFTKTQIRPVPFLTNTEYWADPGQEITFDASDSYVIGAKITKYEWDFDGDGIFEAATTTPTIKHVYNNLFDGYMQVRVYASNGTLANMSAKVKIGTYVVPTLAKAPTDLKIIPSEDDNKSIQLTWTPNLDPLTDKLMLSINGVSMGVMEPNRNSITITDIDNTIDYDFAITALTADNEYGDSVYATLEATNPPALPYKTIVENDSPSAEKPDDKVVTKTTPKDTDDNVKTPQAPTKLAHFSEFTDGDGEVLGITSGTEPTSKPSRANKQSDAGFTWYWLLGIPALLGIAGWRIYRLVKVNASQ